MRWNTADDLTNAIEELDTTVHAGAPIAFSVRHCFAMVSDVVDLVWPEIDRLRAVLTKIRDLHQPMWVSEEAKAAGKKPWVCCWCGTADGSWPCDTRLVADEALAEQENYR